VQAVLAAHNTAGEKDRRHPHYLKGSIWCGECGGRLVYSRNTGRRGGVYEYFVCLNRHAKRRPCQRRYLSVKAVEAGVEDYYRSFQVPPERAAQIRESVMVELAAEREHAAADQRRARERLATLTAQRKAILQAHYNDAIPHDLLKEEMDRLTREMAEAERLARDAGKTVEQLEDTLRRALTVASSCHRHYEKAPPHVRRQINQGFFTKLFIDQDGSVERAELTEPFATLLVESSHEVAGRAQGAPDAPGTVPAADPPAATPSGARGDQGANGHRPANVLVTTFEIDQETSGDLVNAGSKETVLVPAAGFEPALSTT
jgi:site-specific DNA recombinase